MSRYIDTKVVINDHQLHNDMLEKRGLKETTQHASSIGFGITEEDMVFIDFVTETWGKGMSFRRLAHQYYNSPEYWWVIALVNKKPTIAHVKIGESIKVPLNLGEILRLVE